jgi:hypothetical protein
VPAVQSVDLVWLTLFLAAILVLNVRVAGVGMMDWSLPLLERQLKPWTPSVAHPTRLGIG